MKEYIKQFICKELMAIRVDSYEDLHVFMDYMDSLGINTRRVRRSVVNFPICLHNDNYAMDYSTFGGYLDERAQYTVFHKNDIYDDENLL